MQKMLFSLGVLLLLGAGCNTAVNNEVQVDNGSPTQVENTIPVPDTTNPIVEDTSTSDVTQKQEQEQEQEAKPISIAITGKSFEFSQKEITVKKGQTLTINFESTGGFHDFVIDEFSAKTDQVNPGTKTSVTFVADKAGEFDYYCSVGQHRAMGMVGKLIVTDNSQDLEVEVQADADVIIESK